MEYVQNIRIGITLAVLSALVGVPALAETPLGTGFTYQGKLNAGGSPLNGAADFEFTLWDAGSNGNQIGILVEAANVTVTGGLFTTELDFGIDAFDGHAGWLEIAVRSPAGSGDYTTLSPRQPLTAAPVALALRGLRTTESANTILPDSWNILGGHPENSIGPQAGAAVVAGGGQTGLPNSVTSFFGTVSGGVGNTAGGGATVSGGANNFAGGYSASVGGGSSNLADALRSTVGGGNDNTAGETGSTVGGGNGNLAFGSYSVVGGGIDNTTTGNSAFIGGGNGNLATGGYSMIGGGEDNTAAGKSSTVGGGSNNSASQTNSTVAGGLMNQANAVSATVGGGESNVASGMASTVPGGSQNNATGSTSLAAGFRAKANHDGTFVWADSTDADFASTAADQFLISAAGGVGINKTDPGTALDVNGTVTATAFAGDGSGLTNVPADNLGDHIATQTLDMNTFDITGAGTVNANAFVGDGSGLTNVAGDNLGNHTATQALDMASFDIINAGTVSAGAFVGDGSGLTGVGTDVSFGSSVGSPSDAVYVDDQGYVGIGTTNPTGPMQFGNAADVAAFKFGAAGPHHLVSNRDMAFDTFDVDGNPDNDPLFYFRTDNTKFDDSSYSDLVTITDLGRVGIGTTSPSYELDVAGSARIDDNVGIGAAPGSEKLYVNGSARVSGTLRVNSTANLVGDLTVAGGTFQAYQFDGVGVGGTSSNVDFNITNDGVKDTIFNAETSDGVSVFKILANRTVLVNGDFGVSNGSKNFILDNPLDPANKDLRHNAVEGPGYYTLYKGRAVCNDAGEAWVTLPDYFEALNTDYLYQLTCVGGFANVYVAEEVHDNGFFIAGGKPGLMVTWQVTATRNDPWAQDHPYQAVREKKGAERGLLYYPQGYGYPDEMNMMRAHEDNRASNHK